MANILKVKRSAVAGKIPTTSDLELGEIAVNTYDGKMFIKQDDGTETIVEIGGGSSSGDVVGPASATDNAIVRYDGTTGKVIKNSVVTIDDDGNILGSDSIQFSGTIPTGTIPSGTLYFNTSNNTLNFQQNNITQQIGEELFIYGKASSTITNGQLVCKTGAVGASGVITFAPSPSNLTDNDGIIGVATEDIPNNGFGRITSFGVVHGINTTGGSVGETWADGDTLWYNPSGDGTLTNVKPTSPNIKFSVGTVTHAGAGGSGSIQITMTPGSVLGGTDSNVQFSTLNNNDLIQYNSGLGYWTNVPCPAGGIVTTTGTQTLTNKTFQAYSEKVETIGAISTPTYNIDLSLANIFDLTLEANVTVTFTNAPASGFTRPVTLIVRQPSTSPGKTLTVTGAQYTDGTAPILSTGANQKDVLSYWSIDGGSSYFGTFAMANVS